MCGGRCNRLPQSPDAPDFSRHPRPLVLRSPPVLMPRLDSTANGNTTPSAVFSTDAISVRATVAWAAPLASATLILILILSSPFCQSMASHLPSNAAMNVWWFNTRSAGAKFILDCNEVVSA